MSEQSKRYEAADLLVQWEQENASRDAELAALRKRVEELEAEKRRLIGYISTFPPHSEQHPEDVMAWWDALEAAYEKSDATGAER